MVKIKIKKARWPEERQYVHRIYEAFKLEYPYSPPEYAAQVAKDKIIIVCAEQCEEVTDVNKGIVNQITKINDLRVTTRDRFKRDVMDLHKFGFSRNEIVNELFHKYNRDQEMRGSVLNVFRARVRQCIMTHQNKETN